MPKSNRIYWIITMTRDNRTVFRKHVSGKVPQSTIISILQRLRSLALTAEQIVEESISAPKNSPKVNWAVEVNTSEFNWRGAADSVYLNAPSNATGYIARKVRGQDLLSWPDIVHIT